MTIPNSPRPALEGLNDTASAINKWLMDNPVVETDDQARDGKMMLDRGNLALKDLNDERDGQVRPLNERVDSINNEYRLPRLTAQNLTGILLQRLSAFMKKQQEIAEAAAEEARRLADEKIAAAKEAERVEKEKLADASAGELDVNVAELTQAANNAFDEAKLAIRQAARAEREANVKIGGGFTRSLGLRKRKELRIVDVIEALDDLVIPGIIEEAILKAARAYKRANGKLPRGIEEVEVE